VSAHRKAVIASIFAAAVWLRVAPAAAEPRSGLELRWEAPAGCPQEKEVRDRIRVFAPSLEGADVHLRADCAITRADGRFRLKLIVRGGVSGERTIESVSCGELARAAALTLRLLARVAAEDAGTGEAPASAPMDAKPATTPPSTEPTKVITPEVIHTEAPPSTSGLILRAPLVMGDIGPLPSPSIGFGLAVGFRTSGWRFLLSGHLSSERSIGSMVPGYGVDVGRITADLSVCRGLRAGRFELAPCIALTVERMTARGFGERIVPSTQSPTLPSAGATIIGYWYASNWIALFASVGGRIQASRPNITLETIGTVYQVAASAMIVSMGSEWIF
jgi:hypothetical protein